MFRPAMDSLVTPPIPEIEDIIHLNLSTNIMSQARQPAVVHLDKIETASNIMGPAYSRNVRITLLGLMAFFAYLGNVITLVHIWRSNCNSRRIKALFTNLAVADLLVASFALTSQLVWEAMDKEWIAGDCFCRIFKVMQTFTMVLSNYLVVTLAIDRFTSLVLPLKRNNDLCGYSQTNILLFVAWITAIGPSVPSAYVFKEHWTSPDKAICVAKFYTKELSQEDRQVYMGLIFLSVFIIPIVLVGFFYSCILKALWTRSRAFAPHLDSVESVALNFAPRENCAVARFPRAKIKTLKMTIVVVGAFLLTSLPYLVQEMIVMYGDPNSLNPDVAAFCGIFSAFNSVVNPFVYLWFNANPCINYTKARFTCCNCCLTSKLRGESKEDVGSNIFNTTSV